MANGSGVWASRYTASFEHYASWGFIVIGNEHDTAFAGDSSDASLAYLIDADEDPDSRCSTGRSTPTTAEALNWTYHPHDVSIPVMLVAGTEDDVIDLPDLRSLYAQIAAPKAMGRRSDTNHPEMLYSADGYATAWMMWQLRHDERAGAAFVGDDAEMQTNPSWQYTTIDVD